MTKSHAGIGVTLCPVCCAEHDEVVLLDRRLKASLEPKSVTGWDMCPEHKRLKAEGYVALVECTNQPKGLNDAQRTGNLAHVRASVWGHLFNVPVPAGGMCFVDVGVIAKLKEKTA